jgi:thiosulfate dehydrogenase (quinone) large subunit
MQQASSHTDRSSFSSTKSEATASGLQPVTLSEGSLLLVALVRIFVGMLWLQQLAWKMPPTFSGLHEYVVKEAQNTFIPGYSVIIKQVFLTHFTLLGAGVWTAELLVGVMLLFGLCSRVGALLAVVLSLQLYIGLAYAPGEWYWTYGMLVLLGLALVAVPAGRRLGVDQLLHPRVKAAAQTSWLARVLSWCS